MKILLISVNNEKHPYPVSPLGTAYLIGALKKTAHKVSFLDLCFVDDDFQAISQVISTHQPDVIGISLRNIDNVSSLKPVFYLPRIRKITDYIREKTEIPVIIGGSGFSVYPEGVLRFLGLQYGISGEGEEALPLFLDALEGKVDLKEIPNFCSLQNGEFIKNVRQFNTVYSEADRSLMDNERYLNQGGMANIVTKRGCPFGCKYCTYPMINGSNIRLRPPEAIAIELEKMVVDYRIDFAFFVDDIFNFPESHATEICEEIIKRDLKLSWTCFATPDSMSRNLARIMKRAGCMGVEFGTDAGSSTTLLGHGKGFSPEDIMIATQNCKAENLSNAHYLILGGPGENEKTLKETFSLMEKVAPNAVIVFTGVRIFPYSKLEKIALQEGVLDKKHNLVEPAFYISPEIKKETLVEKITEFASSKNNWVVPDLGIGINKKIIKVMRKMGKRGPLWDSLPE